VGRAGATEPKRIRLGRVEAFSDGVFAIAITLLVLEIAVPQDAGDRLLGALGDLWPAYLGYLVSVATIGAVWYAHSVITEYLDHATATLVRLNLLLLMVVAFLPFPTRLFALYLGEERPERVATTFYGASLLLAALLISLLWQYAVRAGLVRPDADPADIAMLTRRLTPGLAGYLAMIALGLVLPVLAAFGYLAIAVYLLVPVGLQRHRG
jgi:uncharacterized membrane protein